MVWRPKHAAVELNFVKINVLLDDEVLINL
jgi:hypothetical protein